MLEILTDNHSLKHSLRKVFKHLIEEEVNAILVDLHTTGNLEKAMKLNANKNPIILFSDHPKKEFNSDLIFKALISKKKIGYIKMPFNIDIFISLYKNLLKEENPPSDKDKKAIELAKLRIRKLADRNKN